MRSIKKFTSSEEFKSMQIIKGGNSNPVYLGWSDTNNGADEELITKNGTDPTCSGFGVGHHNCSDDFYECGGMRTNNNNSNANIGKRKQ